MAFSVQPMFPWSWRRITIRAIHKDPPDDQNLAQAFLQLLQDMERRLRS